MKHRVGSPCKDCGAALERINYQPHRQERRRRRAIAKGSFYYLWTLRCPRCRKKYVDDSVLRWPSEELGPLHPDAIEVTLKAIAYTLIEVGASTKHDPRRWPLELLQGEGLDFAVSAFEGEYSDYVDNDVNKLYERLSELVKSHPRKGS